MLKIKRNKEKKVAEKEKDLIITQLTEQLNDANAAFANAHLEYVKLLAQKTCLMNDNLEVMNAIERYKDQILGKETYFHVYKNELFAVVSTMLVKEEGKPDRLEVQMVKV